MKILFLAHRTPYPPDKGDKIRSFHVLSQLARRHSVSLVYWVDDPKDMIHSIALRDICGGTVTPVRLNRRRAALRAAGSLAKGGSLSAGYYRSSVFARIVGARVKEECPELIYVFSSAMAQYAAPFDKLARIVDYVDVDSEKWRQLAQCAPFPMACAYRLEHKRLARFETAVSRWVDCSIFVSDAESRLFADIGGQGAIVTVPNGVTVDSLLVPHQRACAERQSPVRSPRGAIHILFIGTMNYLPNIDAVLYFARDILPRIRKVFPESVFDIVGRAPSRAVRNLSAVDGVRIHGEVANLRPFLLRADVSVAPLRIARGVPNKILEAMAVGIPVIATSEAIKGIGAKDEEDLLLGDTPEKFSEQVIRLLTDHELRGRIAKQARHCAQERYNWQRIGDQLNEIIERVCPTRSRRTA